MGLYKNNNGTLELISGATLFADSPIGAIIPYGSSNIPNGYLLCDGAAISRTTYAELFAVIGTSFGVGDGSTTFNLPDIRESVPKGAGLTGKTVGAHLDADGLAVGEFLDDRLQGHNHNPTQGAYTQGSGSFLVEALSGAPITNDLSQYITTDGTNGTPRVGATTEVKSVGVNYIIKAKQVAIPADFVEAAADAGEAAAEEVVALKQNITDNTLQTTSKTVPGAINEAFNHAKKIGGDANYTWMDIPADESTSGKQTRLFIHDQDLFVGTQLWDNGALQREGKFYFKPTPQQITFLNGATSAEPANCNIVDYGAFIVVNLANVTIPNDFAQFNYFMQLPAFARTRINFTVPTSTGQEIVYIDANTRELRITNKVDQQIFTNMIIPVGSERY